jgi:predicted methyltransferase
MLNQYIKDSDNEDLIVDVKGFQVMMEWEKPYMEALVDNLQPHGDVLEIGFGFGYSASQIMKHPIKSYTVIECDKNAIKLAKKWAKKQPVPVNIIEGVWQVEIHKVSQQFDCAFFDDSPRYELPAQTQESDMFFFVMLKRLAKKNCRVTWYCQNYGWWSCHPATKYSTKVFDIEIPQKCLYMPPKLIKAGKLIMPLLEYPLGALTKDELEFYANA